MRQARFAGKFYPANKEELEKQLEIFVKKKDEEEKEDIKGAIVPHAGYTFSGKLAGKVISKIPKKSNFIIFGVNHSGIGKKISVSFEDFETGLGIVENNQGLGKKIVKLLKDANNDEEAHNYEHSIEVQLPFLQKTQEAKIVPILLRDLNYEECKKIAKVIAKLLNDNITVLISGDFTHYGINYGFVVKGDTKENIYKIDKSVINSVLKLDSKAVFEKASKSTICGIFGLTIITEIAKIKSWKAKLIDYYTSGDVLGDYENAVGYAGIIFQ